jgi:hypothetical protein
MFRLYGPEKERDGLCRWGRQPGGAGYPPAREIRPEAEIRGLPILFPLDREDCEVSAGHVVDASRGNVGRPPARLLSFAC